MTLDLILKGLQVTLIVWVGGMALSLVLAVPVAAMGRSRHRLVRGVSIVWVGLWRGVPPVVWLFILYFGIQSSPWSSSPAAAAAVGLGLVNSAYVGEALRAGLNAVPRGQLEAAAALCLPRLTTYRQVIFPQAWPMVLASTTSYSITLMKNTSLASLIGANEIVYYAAAEVREGADGVVVFFSVGLIFIILCLPLSVLARRLDARAAIARTR